MWAWIKKRWKWIAGIGASLVGVFVVLGRIFRREDPGPVETGHTERKVDKATKAKVDEIEDDRDRALRDNPFRLRKHKD